jgi:hypothetical protein
VVKVAFSKFRNFARVRPNEAGLLSTFRVKSAFANSLIVSFFFHLNKQQTMEEIKDIIQTVVKGCSAGGVTVSDILAAFVARTVRGFGDALFRVLMILFLGYRR